MGLFLDAPAVWTVGELSDWKLRQIAIDYVDVMRTIAANRDANGYVIVADYGKDTLDAISRLTGFTDVDNISHTYVCDSYNTFLAMHGQGGSQWPMVNSYAVFGLAMDRAIPNSTLKDLLIVGGLTAALTAPFWGPPLVGALTTGAQAVWDKIEQLFARIQSDISVTDKLNRYLLNPTHPIGREKAEFFKRALGYTRENMTALARQIVFNPNTAIPTTLTQFGQKYKQVIRIVGANGRSIDVKTIWINIDGIYKLITAIPAK